MIPSSCGRCGSRQTWFGACCLECYLEISQEMKITLDEQRRRQIENERRTSERRRGIRSRCGV